MGCYRWSRDKSLTYRDMEDFFLLLLSAVADLLFEVFFLVVAEEVVGRCSLQVKYSATAVVVRALDKVRGRPTRQTSRLHSRCPLTSEIH